MSSTDDPFDSEELRDTMTLSMTRGVGPRIRQALVERFGTPGEILSAAPSDLQTAPGVGAKIARQIANARNEIDVDTEIAVCRQNGLRVLTEDSPDYPRLLKEIHDPPGLLFCRGDVLGQDAMAIAIVGTRHASRYGLDQAERLANSLSRAGMTIVSGLARGVDAAAHRGALAAGGRTLGFLGSGILNIYPPEHGELADQVSSSGALLSESAPRMQPMSGAFPQRNRLISGMSLGVVVIEAAERSGALITARHAYEQGREVFAVPGRIDNRLARGCHQLIRDGAKLVESADDVLEELGPLVESAKRDDGTVMRHPAELALNEIEQKVLQSIDVDSISIDEVIAQSGLPAHRVLSTISVLEMRRLVRRLSGNLVSRV